MNSPSFFWEDSKETNAEKLSVQPSLFSAPSLFQPSLFSFSAAPPFFLLFFSVPLFLFSFVLSLLVQPSIFQPKTVLSPKPKTFCFKSPNVLLLLVQPLFSVPALFLSKFFSLPTSKAIKKSSFGSIYPSPNILSSCFTSLLFE